MTIPHHQCSLYDQFCDFSMTGQGKSKSENIVNSITPQCTHQCSTPLYIENRLSMSSDSNDCMMDYIMVVKSHHHPEKFEHFV
jgi:hypothetical protein